ncbi:MAG: HD domain-containing protein, partial [Kiritimatiellia bacterium]|nr:HD domain-containing protein [Kiritimatiellia bacterium]
ARALAAKYRTDLAHGEQVAEFGERLFDELQTEHQLDGSHRFLLRIASLLHEIGLFVGNRGHHKHSLYLILNSDLFGLTRDDILLVALVARYHRRNSPSPLHPEYASLPRERRLMVQKLAAILRVADALARARRPRLPEIAIARDENRLTLTLNSLDDVSLERMALVEKGGLFTDIYGLEIALRTTPLLKGPESNV